MSSPFLSVLLIALYALASVSDQVAADFDCYKCNGSFSDHCNRHFNSKSPYIEVIHHCNTSCFKRATVDAVTKSLVYERGCLPNTSCVSSAINRNFCCRKNLCNGSARPMRLPLTGYLATSLFAMAAAILMRSSLVLITV